MHGEGDPARLPSGTVTFLFTDIEGSTGRWQAHPHEMQECVEQHDALLRRAIEDASGHVVKQFGDGMMAVFDDAHRAIAAAVASSPRQKERAVSR